MKNKTLSKEDIEAIKNVVLKAITFAKFQDPQSKEKLEKELKALDSRAREEEVYTPLKCDVEDCGKDASFTSIYDGTWCEEHHLEDSSKKEKCFCQSYYDDNNELRDCTCGKCHLPKQQESWEERFDEKLGYLNKMPAGAEFEDYHYEEIKDFIRDLLTKFKES